MPANPVDASLSTSPAAVPDEPANHAACGLALGYLVFRVRKPLRWERFCGDMLGLPDAVANPDGSRGYRMDGAMQRLIVAEGAEDDLAALGLTCEDDTVLDALAARLRRMQIAVEDGGEGLRASRRVRRLMVIRDPDGNTVELAVGMEAAPVPFASPAFRSGFHTGRLGMGHAVLVSHRLEAMEAFYTGALGRWPRRRSSEGDFLETKAVRRERRGRGAGSDGVDRRERTGLALRRRGSRGHDRDHGTLRRAVSPARDPAERHGARLSGRAGHSGRVRRPAVPLLRAVGAQRLSRARP